MKEKPLQNYRFCKGWIWSSRPTGWLMMSLNMFMFFGPVSSHLSPFLPSPTLPSLLSSLPSSPILFSSLLYSTLLYSTGEGKGEEWSSPIPSSPLLFSLLVFFFTSQPVILESFSVIMSVCPVFSFLLDVPGSVRLMRDWATMHRYCVFVIAWQLEVLYKPFFPLECNQFIQEVSPSSHFKQVWIQSVPGVV